MSPKACASTVHDCSARNPKVDTPMTIIVVSTVLLLLLPYPSSLVQGLASSNEQSQETGLSGLPKQDEEDLIVQYDTKIKKLTKNSARIGNIHQNVLDFINNMKIEYPAVDTSELKSKYEEVKSKLAIIRGSGIPRQKLNDVVEKAFENYKLQSTNAASDLQASKAKLEDLINQLEELVVPLEPIIKWELFHVEVARPLWYAKRQKGSPFSPKPIEPESVLKQLDTKAMSSILDAYVKMESCVPDSEEAIQAAKDALREYEIALGQTKIEKKDSFLKKESWSSPWTCGGKTPCYATPLGQVIALAGGFFLGGLLGVAVIENEITTTGSTLFVDSTPTSVRDGNDSSDDNSQLWIILLVVGLLLSSIFALAFYYFNGKQKTLKRGAKDLEAKDPGSKDLTTAEPKQSTTGGTTGATTGPN